MLFDGPYQFDGAGHASYDVSADGGKFLMIRNPEGGITELRVVNVLCNATTSQQAATRELAAQVDLMIVVGGHNSANTRHLAELAKANGVETYHVEEPGELQPGWFRGRDNVGVTAGASTPDFSIDAAVQRIEEIDAALQAAR